MRKFCVLAMLLWPSLSWAWMGMGGSPDYSRDASSMFYCASSGTVTTQAGVSASSPTISLFNPANSGKNLVLLDAGLVFMASPAAASDVVLAFNVTPSSGPQTGTGARGVVTPALIGKSSTTALGVCNLLGNLPAVPSAFRVLGGTTGASAISGVVLTDSTNGKVVIPPGGLVSVQTTTAANVLAHLLWREDSL